MSHFSVLVISDTKLTEETLKPILQPWHEYECTGVQDQYVIDVDITNKVEEEFNKPQRVVIIPTKIIYNPAEKIFSRWDERFYTGKPKNDWDRKEFVLPKGAIDKEISAEEARQAGIGYKTMGECAKEYFGGFKRGDRYYKKTNPQAKWDWWQVGGRSSGRFIPFYEPEKDPKNQEVCFLCQGTGKRTDMVSPNGCNGCQGTGVSTKWPTQWKTDGNIAQLKDIPVEQLRTIAEIKALVEYDKAHKIIAGRPIPDWDHLRETMEIEAARDLYYNDPVIKDLTAGGFDRWYMTEFLDDLRLSRLEKALRARRRALQTYAVVKDGKWYERGEMGWFGCASNEKDRDQWDKEFSDLIDGLPPETWLAVVDCHI